MNSERNNLLNFIAFIAVIIIAVLEVFNVLAHFGVLTVGGTLINLLNTIKNLAILLVMGITAYKYAEHRKKGVRITYWVCIAVIVVATVLMWL